MRIAFVYNSARIIGGGEIGFTELIRRAREEEDITPVVIVPGPGEVSDLLDRHSIPWQVVSMPTLRRSGNLVRLPVRVRRFGRLLKAEGVDIVHANGARCMLYAGAAGRLAGIPVIWHVRVLERDRVLDDIRARLATRIICISHAVAATLPRRPAERKIVVIYNGVDQERFRTAAPADVHALFGIPRDRKPVLVAALIVKWKGQADALEALRRMPPDFRAKVQLLFAGRELTPGAPFTAVLKARARQLGIENHITWCGHRTDLPEIMRGSDVLLLPSHGEPFGRVIVEAWAAGLPVICTAGGGAGEIVEHGRTGWVVPQRDPQAIADALQKVLGDAALRERLIRAGRERADDFTLERHARQVIGLYRTLYAAG